MLLQCCLNTCYVLLCSIRSHVSIRCLLYCAVCLSPSTTPSSVSIQNQKDTVVSPAREINIHIVKKVKKSGRVLMRWEVYIWCSWRWLLTWCDGNRYSWATSNIILSTPSEWNEERHSIFVSPSEYLFKFRHFFLYKISIGKDIKFLWERITVAPESS